ncbi:bacterial dynamin-like protein [Argopecten irradians]|uniref:bacterial dynamin-like protein n=1 Tax=Argopecten irradians TaxID=31199 RepID=UPI003716AABA
MAQVAITRTQFQEKLKQLIAKDDRDCELLVDVYNDVKTCAENSSLVKGLVLQHDPDFFEHVKQGLTDLREADRPILVIGETSAGKSSFLNLLIGRKVLPELAAPCTHCMCCIKKGRKLEAHVSSFDGSDLFGTEIISADGKSDKEFRDELQELVNEDNCDEALDRYIEIFVPSSILEDNVYLVDTPGFGENEQVTKSLMKYLPNAIGIIFILNTTVSIGIAEDRGVLILDEIKQLREEGKIPSFDPTKILFIGNKWDQIPEEERHDHRLKIIRKMKTVWPKFHENQFVPLSVIYVLRLQYTASVQEDYKSATTDYETVLDRIRQVVEHCCSARSKVHKRLLLSVFKHMKTFVDATVTHILLSVEEKQAKVKRLQGLVKNMVSTYNEGKAKMVTLADHIQISVVEEFHQYLNNMENRQHIFPWKKSNMPKGTDYNAVKEKAFVTIRAFITEAVVSQYLCRKSVRTAGYERS